MKTIANQEPDSGIKTHVIRLVLSFLFQLSLAFLAIIMLLNWEMAGVMTALSLVGLLGFYEVLLITRIRRENEVKRFCRKSYR